MNDYSLDIVWRNANELKPYERNAKIHTKTQIANVAKSLQKFGWRQPVVIDSNDVIVIGHCRVLAAQSLGITVPCLSAADLSAAEIKELRLLDNKLNESEYDEDILVEELEETSLDDFDLDWGIKIRDEVASAKAEAVQDDVPEIPVEPVCKSGDLWQLGNHRLLCGDATSGDCVKFLTGGVEMDMLVTDPPYGISYVGGTSDKLTIKNDDLRDDSLRRFLQTAFAASNSVLKAGGAFYIWHASSTVTEFLQAAAAVGWQMREMLIWVKNRFTFGRQDYQWQHEPCIYGWKDGAPHYFIDRRSESTVISDAERLDLNSLDWDELKELAERLIAEKEVPTTVIFEKKPLRSEDHPTMKPVKLIARLIKNSSRPGENILDCFGGSGSTLIACEQLDRNCFMMELDPKYCDVIIQRWENYSGKKAVLLNAG